LIADTGLSGLWDQNDRKRSAEGKAIKKKLRNAMEPYLPRIKHLPF